MQTPPLSKDAENAGQRMWIAIGLLWLAGNALRLTILAVPPVIAMIRDDFGLSATEVGLLSSIPPALFAIAALAGSLLVAHLGLKAALVGSLMLVSAGSALRGLSTTYTVLLVTTIVMSAGVAIMQPIMPTAVRQWLLRHIPLGTAIYLWAALLGFSDAAALIVGLTLPALLCRAEDVARTAAGTFTISYGGAVAIAVASC